MASAHGAPRLRDWASLVRFSHTIFALPFALIALLVATGGRPSLRQLALIVAAMVAARTAAMAFNRWADRHLDARNPRTASREIPAGVVSARAALALTLFCSLAFVALAWLLAPVCGWLALPTLAVLLGYSYAKRITAAVHGWLGVALGLAPPAAWVAVQGQIDSTVWAPLALGAGVAVWVAGFDVLYSCQDADFDREEGLHSIPARFGVARALHWARGMHLLAVVGFAAFGWMAGLGWFYAVGVLLAAALLAYEHRLVRVDDLSRIRAAFFTMNGMVSVGLLGFTILDLVF